jgi:hypothetical protein
VNFLDSDFQKPIPVIELVGLFISKENPAVHEPEKGKTQNKSKKVRRNLSIQVHCRAI